MTIEIVDLAKITSVKKIIMHILYTEKQSSFFKIKCNHILGGEKYGKQQQQ